MSPCPGLDAEMASGLRLLRDRFYLLERHGSAADEHVAGLLERVVARRLQIIPASGRRIGDITRFDDFHGLLAWAGVHPVDRSPARKRRT